MRLIHERLDRTTPDHLPSCPSCGDLCPGGATVCDGCGGRLTPTVGELAGILRREAALSKALVLRKGRGVLAAAPEPAPLTEHQWTCANCLRDHNEPYCDECGANLMEVKR